jgi:hypothetical protein
VNVNQGHAIITPQVHVADINRALAFNGEGTALSGRARAAQILLSYKASYGGFIDRRIRAADNPAIPGPPPIQPEQGEVEEEEEGARTPPFSSDPILLADEASTSSSSGYTPSPPHQEMDQPIDLSSLLTLPGAGRGRGRGTARGRGRSQSPVPSHGRRGSTQPDFPPGFQPDGAEASHRDKRPRLEEATGGSLTAQPAPAPAWTPRFSRGNRPITVRDSVDSEGTAIALSQAFMLPLDMQKELASSPDNLLGSFMVHSAKV